MPVKKITKGGLIKFAARVVKADTQNLIVNDVMTYDDEFVGMGYADTTNSNVFIEPPYNQITLVKLITKNNILSQCVQSMEVNIDGTGWVFFKKEQDDKKKLDLEEEESDKAEKLMLESFFEEPYPQVSFLTIRRTLRYDMETTGNAYLEVIRNLAGEVIFLRRIDPTLVRLVRYDDAIEVEKTVIRAGSKFTAKVMTRERRYVQVIGTRMLYFRELGSSRELNRNTGKWVPKNEKLEPENRASEIIHLTLERDVTTQYGVPRWINQLPSILGSRKAEEFNLDFFDNGGIPPAIIFIQGGALLEDVQEQLMGYLNGKSSHRVAVVSVQSTSGTLDSAGSVQVRTERFGDVKTSDSMFSNYDKICEEHVRTGFRLPPLFVGKASDYNFATAMTTYLVTEAQVFEPERREFDEIVNTRILPLLGASVYKMRSNPITLKNIETQLQAIEMVQKCLDPADLISDLNSLTGLTMKHSPARAALAEYAAFGATSKQVEENNGEIPMPTATDQTAGSGEPGKGGPGSAGTAPKVKPQQAAAGGGETNPAPPGGKNVIPFRKSEAMTPEEVVSLVNDWTTAMGLTGGRMEDTQRQLVLKSVRELSETQRRLFDNVLASKSFSSLGRDPAGLAEIASCCVDQSGRELGNAD